MQKIYHNDTITLVHLTLITLSCALAHFAHSTHVHLGLWSTLTSSPQLQLGLLLSYPHHLGPILDPPQTLPSCSKPVPVTGPANICQAVNLLAILNTSLSPHDMFRLLLESHPPTGSYVGDSSGTGSGGNNILLE